MSKALQLYEKEETSFQSKFFRLADLLVSNKSFSRMESILFISISYIQLISGFFDPAVGVFTSGEAPDTFLYTLKKVLRIRDLIDTDYSTLTLVIYILLILIILFEIYFNFLIYHTKAKPQYTYKEMLVNFCFKFFFYVLFTPILDIVLNLNCTQATTTASTCGSFPILILVSIIVLLYSIFLAFMLSLYYNDSNLLSNGFYSRISCNYEIYYTINLISFAIMLKLINSIGTLVFFSYNVIISLLMLRFFFQRYPFYDSITSFIIGLFHVIYAWTSVFCILYYYIQVQIKSIMYIAGILILVALYRNIREVLENKIVFDTPYHKITNTNYILTYIKIIQRMIHNVENVVEEKASLVGIIQLHCIECPLADCPAKKKEKMDLFLPVTEEWSIRSKEEINDKVYLLNFITFVYTYYISQDFYSADMLLNLASYYLTIIGNFNKAIFYLQKAKEMKLSTQESFAYYRLRNFFQKSFTEKLKPSNEVCLKIEDLNMTYYYKYQDLGQKFFNAISNDVNLNLEFWKVLKAHKETYQKLDLNQVFEMTDKIRKTKVKIDGLWGQLFDTYNNYNEMFDLYENYIDVINNDNVIKRDLDFIKSKLIIQNEQIGMNNQYNILFDKDTAVIIIKLDDGKEGLIEHVNDVVCAAFDYKREELIGSYINMLMPKVFDIQHQSILRRQKNVAEKRIVDKNVQVYGKNRQNCLIPISARVKFFPVVSESLYFSCYITADAVDDVILLDSKFNIQGMSTSLMQRFELNYKIFQEVDIPFYLISKNFLEHYKKNMTDVKLEINIKAENVQRKSSEISDTTNTKLVNSNKLITEYIEDRMNINENSELEFEIKIPNLLKSYTGSDNANEIYDYYSIARSVSHTDNDEVQLNNGIIVENPNEEEEGESDEGGERNEENENENLINGNLQKKKTCTSKNSQHNYSMEEEKEYQNKINYYRNIFEKKNYDSLEKEIDKLCIDTKEAHKFVFTFNIFKFAENQIAYIVRCIDNREVSAYSTTVDVVKNSKNKEENFEKRNDNIFNRRKYIASLKEIHVVDKDDQEKMKEMMSNYYNLLTQDIKYNRMMTDYHQEMLQFSRVFGLKDINYMVDEVSSQSSSASYNDDLMKKAKVDDIKSNILRNVSDLNIFKFIKVLFFLMILFTLGFSFLIIINFDNLSNDSAEINDLSTLFYHNTFSIASLVSSLISMKSLYETLLNSGNFSDINFLTFLNLYNQSSGTNSSGIIEQQYYDYFQFHSNYIMDNYAYLIKSNFYIEYNFTKYTPNSTLELFWVDINSGAILNNSVNISIEYPTAYYRSLSLTNELIKSDYFNLNYLLTLNSTSLPAANSFKYNYDITNTIDSFYNYIIPHELMLLSNINGIFSTYNTNNLSTITLILICYSSIILLLCALYLILLYQLNNSMQRAIEKVTRINLLQIQDIIKVIESFNYFVMNKFRKKENGEIHKIHLDNAGEHTTKRHHESQEVSSKFEDDRDKHQLKRKFLFSNEKTFIKLRVLNGTYLQIFGIFSVCCLFLITIFLQSFSLVSNLNMFLSMKSFIYGDLIQSGINVLSTKSFMAQININQLLDNQGGSNDTDYQTKKTESAQIEYYPLLNSFYTTQYLFSICDTIFTDNDTNYPLCVNDAVVKSANNTASLLSVIDDSIFVINKEIQLNKTIELNLLFGTNDFEKIEYVYYNYITRIPPILDAVLSTSARDFITRIQTNALIMILIFSFLITLISLYISVSYIKKLIHKYSVARCILKIIPTNVIYNTPEIFDWINKF